MFCLTIKIIFLTIRDIYPNVFLRIYNILKLFLITFISTILFWQHLYFLFIWYKYCYFTAQIFSSILFFQKFDHEIKFPTSKSSHFLSIFYLHLVSLFNAKCFVTPQVWFIHYHASVDSNIIQYLRPFCFDS